MRHSVVTVGIFCCLTILASPDPHLYAQSSGKSTVSSPSIAALAKPMDFGTYSAHIFQDDPRQISFHLVTSWIPGENHKGMLRYQLTALAAQNESFDIESQEKFMKRVANCGIALNVYDEGGFILRKHIVSFAFGVTNDARVHSLYANDAFQMDAQEYRALIGNSKGSGSWNVSWNCVSQ